jgi:hypothetical protein
MEELVVFKDVYLGIRLYGRRTEEVFGFSRRLLVGTLLQDSAGVEDLAGVSVQFCEITYSHSNVLDKGQLRGIRRFTEMNPLFFLVDVAPFSKI